MADMTQQRPACWLRAINTNAAIVLGRWTGPTTVETYALPVIVLLGSMTSEVLTWVN